MDEKQESALQIAELIAFANTFDDRLVSVKDIITFYLDMAYRFDIPPKDIRFSIFDILSNLGSVSTANIKIRATFNDRPLIYSEIGSKRGETE